MVSPELLFIELRVALSTHVTHCDSIYDEVSRERYLIRAEELEKLTDKYRQEFIDLIAQLQKRESQPIGPPLHLKD